MSHSWNSYSAVSSIVVLHLGSAFLGRGLERNSGACVACNSMSGVAV